jgi:hypothetical protein
MLSFSYPDSSVVIGLHEESPGLTALRNFIFSAFLKNRKCSCAFHFLFYAPDDFLRGILVGENQLLQNTIKFVKSNMTIQKRTAHRNPLPETTVI